MFGAMMRGINIIVPAVLFFYSLSECNCKDCGSHEFTFDGKGSYLTYLGTLPDVDILTICQYISIGSNGAFLGALRSYSTATQPNVLYNYARMTDKGAEMIFQVDGEMTIGRIKFPPNSEAFLCQIINSIENEVEIVMNSTIRNTNKVGDFGSIPQGGELRIGRTHNESMPVTFKGKMRNIMMWGRKLTAKEIDDIFNKNVCPEDEIVSIRNTNVRFHGNFFPQADCVDTDFMLNNTGNKVEFVKILNTFPIPESATFCSWLTTDANGMVPGTVGSYVVGDDVDVLLAAGQLMNGKIVLKVGVKGHVQATQARLARNTEYNFCLLYNLIDSKVLTYINGKFVAEITFPRLGPIGSGGSVIVGQRQGCTGGCFDEDKAYTGRIRDFSMWARLLSDKEVESLFKLDKCPTDYAITLSPDNILVQRYTIG